MSRVFVCLFVLSILNIAVRFGACENNTIPDTEDECEDVKITPGSDETRLSSLEKTLRRLMLPIDAVGNIIGKDEGSFGKVLEKFSDYIHVIYPGTLWCGSGDIARKESNLGIFNRTDTCCRVHDNCKNNIKAGETEVNLKNNGIFTRSACFCDTQFYNCLKNTSSPIAFKIGVTYFNVLQPQCFQCICPTKDCDPREDDTECKNHCMKYEWVNNNKNIWVDQKKY